MTERSERVHVTLFVPGTPSCLDSWRGALGSTGIVLGDESLTGPDLTFGVDVEWVDNPRDGSFGRAFSFGTASESQQRAIDDAGGALVLSLRADLHRERAAIASLGRKLATCGALAVRIEESKVGYPVQRWIELIDGADPWSLYRAAVVVLGGEDVTTTCGMQVFSLPDAQVALDSGIDAEAANRLLGVLNVFQITEDPVLATGHTFSPAAEAPKRLLQRWPDATYRPGHACHNPFGVWRLGPPGGTGDADGVALVPVPPLVSVLMASEGKAGRPLTREQVTDIASKCTCIAMKHRDARTLERSRGYADIDPERAWEQWLLVREEVEGSQRNLMTPADRFDLPKLRHGWRWLVPDRDTPLFISGMGDWVFGAPDGSLWCLDVLEGTYSQLAANAAEYNTFNKNHDWLEEKFSIDWFDVALQRGLAPTDLQCVGWKVHPLLGGKFEVANLQVFDMLVYQSLMGQLHQQLQARSPKPASRRPWYKFW